MVRAWTPPRPDRTPRPASPSPAEPTPPPASPSSGWLGEMDWIAGAGWATAALLVSTGFLVPWYVAWLLPLAALSSDKRLLAVAVILTGVGLTTL